MKETWNEKNGRLHPSGLVVSGSSGATEIEGPVEVIFAGFVGALVGLVIGLLAGAVTRVVTINSIKGIRGGMHWGAYGAGAGAVIVALIELID